MPLSRRSLLGLFAAAPVAAVAAKLPFAPEPDIYAEIAKQLGTYGTVVTRTTVEATEVYGYSPAMYALGDLVELNGRMWKCIARSKR